MGVSIGFNVGPVRVSKRIGGGRRRARRRGPSALTQIAGIERDLNDIHTMRTTIDEMPAEEIRRRHRFGWVVAAFFALTCAFGGLVGLPISAAILVGTWWGHRARWARVAAIEARRDAAVAAHEAREAGAYLTREDRAWFAEHGYRA